MTSRARGNEGVIRPYPARVAGRRAAKPVLPKRRTQAETARTGRPAEDANRPPRMIRETPQWKPVPLRGSRVQRRLRHSLDETP